MADRSEENLPVRTAGAPARSSDNGRSGDEHGAGLLYKPGEGYWVRVLTAVAVAGLFLFAAAWAYKALEAFPVPTRGYSFALKAMTGQVSAGQTIELLSSNNAEGQAEVIGTGTLTKVTASGSKESLVEIDTLSMSGGKEPEDASNQSARIGPAGQAVIAQVARVERLPAFELSYLQTAVAAVLLLGGAIIAYYLAGVRHGSVDFLISTDNEMKKVNWSTRREIIGSTQVVVAAFILIAAVLFLLDYFFSHSFIAIDLLRKK